MDKQREAYLLAPLTLAYIGDAVYDLYVRRRLIEGHGGEPPHKLHMRASAIVRASAQAHTVASVMAEFTETELKVYKRGRNANSGTVPKNAEVADYRMATGLEAVIGFLYMAGDAGRLDELLTLCEKGWTL